MNQDTPLLFALQAPCSSADTLLDGSLPVRTDLHLLSKMALEGLMKNQMEKKMENEMETAKERVM